MQSASPRADVLATRFEAINAELLAEVEGYDEARWFAICDEEQASVAAVVSHVAGSYRAITGWAGTIAKGEPLPEFTRGQIDAGNARHAERHARRPKDETLEALRHNGAEAAAFVRGLSDADLDRSGYLPQFERTMTAGELIDDRLIGHPTEHLASIRTTV